MSSNSDEADWAEACSGNGEAFGRIFDRHRARMYRHSYHLVPRGPDADDVVAIAFMEAWRRRSSARFVDGSMLPWLLIIVTNSARNVSRGARRYRALLEKLPAAEHSPETSVSDDPAGAALSRLSLADQQVITLCVLDGYSERETAEALGIPAGTVKSRLSRAKARLAHELRAEWPLPTSDQTSAPKEAANEL